MEQLTIDRGTKIFYGTLLGLIVLDLIFILWILSSFAHFETTAYAIQTVRAVSDVKKPSPFEVANAKLPPVPGTRGKIKPIGSAAGR